MGTAMSRGLGRIERWIAKDIERQRVSDPPTPIHVHAWEIACEFKDHGWDFSWQPTRAQRKAVVRAMHSFVRKHPQYALTERRGRKGVGLILYEIADPVSVTWAKLRMEWPKFVSLSDVKVYMAKQAAL
jgi:hypothetical protein